jgi:predicted nucleic acid-binding protein
VKRVFVDANVFLRFFTRDDEGHHQRAAGLFERAVIGEISLHTGPPVFFEVAWTLRSSYDLSNDEVLDVLSRMLSLPGMHTSDADLVADAISRSRDRGVEFADAYIMSSATASKVDEIATFNRSDFRKLGAELYKL